MNTISTAETSARIIESAPDLFRSLAILADWISDQPQIPQEIADDLQAAIAIIEKIEGK